MTKMLFTTITLAALIAGCAGGRYTAVVPGSTTPELAAQAEAACPQSNPRERAACLIAAGHTTATWFRWRTGWLTTAGGYADVAATGTPRAAAAGVVTDLGRCEAQLLEHPVPHWPSPPVFLPPIGILGAFEAASKQWATAVSLFNECLAPKGYTAELRKYHGPVTDPALNGATGGGLPSPGPL